MGIKCHVLAACVRTRVRVRVCVRVCVAGGGNVAYYIVKTGTSDGRAWATHKRFSEFAALRDMLLAASGYASKINAIPFPAKVCTKPPPTARACALHGNGG